MVSPTPAAPPGGCPDLTLFRRVVTHSSPHTQDLPPRSPELLTQVCAASEVGIEGTPPSPFTSGFPRVGTSGERGVGEDAGVSGSIRLVLRVLEWEAPGSWRKQPPAVNWDFCVLLGLSHQPLSGSCFTSRSREQSPEVLSFQRGKQETSPDSKNFRPRGPHWTCPPAAGWAPGLKVPSALPTATQRAILHMP